MCGRYTVIETDGIWERFNIETTRFEVQPNYNVAPTQTMPVVTRHSPNSLELMRWGLIPFWAKDPKIGYKMINARAESVAEKPSFKKALQTKRCIVPTSGFYEWKKTPEGKTPYFIHLKNEMLFGFAGLYDTWKDPEGNEVYTYTIITTEPNTLMESIHNRMPVILSKDEEDEWLNPDNVEPEKLMEFLKPFPSLEMEAYQVSSLVNSPKNNFPEITRRIN